jgi:putative tricarboxylic transport membrane protein
VSGDTTRTPDGTPEAAPDPRSRPGIGDLVAGSLAVLFGAGVLLYVRGFPTLPGGLPGPALFPGIRGALFVVFGAVLLVQWFRARRGFAPSVQEAPERPPVSRRQGLNALAVVLSVLVYVLVVDLLGFPVTMTVLLFVLMRLLGTRVLVAAGASLVTTGLLVLLFQYVLLVPLPAGVLG